MKNVRAISLSLIAVAGLAAGMAHAQPAFTFSTGTTDGRMAVGTRPESTGNIEIEAADDFLVPTEVRLTSATFVGLIPLGAGLDTVEQVNIEIYRVFPLDSDTTRIIHVPTRNNSPSDNAFATVDSVQYLNVQEVAPQLTAGNSVLNGIHQSPAQNTQGEGPVTGREIQITASLNNPIDLPPGHYFFVPQVQLTSGQFFWLSAPKPITAGTPFNGDLQAWIRNSDLDPDWLRVGADIVGGTPAPAFNTTFSLTGTYVCYANCDGSSVAPILNVNDFQCFLNAFAAGSPYANCDESTYPPVLNVNDFQCFINRYAVGCS